MKINKEWLTPLALALALAAVLVAAGSLFSVADNKNLSKVTFAVS